MIRVSCVIGTYGDESWLEMAKNSARPSARDQGFTDIHIQHMAEGTLAEARNEGARRAQGDALVFLDADDQLAPGYLDAMRKGRDPVAANMLLVPAVQYVRNGVAEKPHIPQQGQWPKLNVAVIGTAISRALFEQVGGFRETTDDGTPLTIYEDYDCFLRMYDAGARLAYVPDAVYCAHVNAAGRNSGGDAAPVYNAIWSDHLSRL